ncbi:fructose-bisphosphate aldolase class I [Candidatus Azambacteria bacterium]|nr:fructose-bisphosphate aldolase class I [Candidatus Azambacteria bacterium]
MDTKSLNAVAMQMVAPGKGILAADESPKTATKRFENIGVSCTEDSRRAYREMLFTAPGIGKYISGVILHDETIRQSAANGESLVAVLEAAGILPGIKVDQGTKAMDGSPEEKITTGLDGLSARLEEYVKLGAKFAKWRAVITIGNGLPTDANLQQNAKDLAAYARLCQEAALVPIVEPEVLMDWSNDMEGCERVSERNLTFVFEELSKAGVVLEGMILKTNMVVPGKQSGEAMIPEKVAEATVRLFRKVLPQNLTGEAFLSGGQSEIEATENLNAIAKLGPFPWNLSFSYGRALQDSAMKTWAGKTEHVPTAQKILYHRAQMNGLATLGKYKGESGD